MIHIPLPARVAAGLAAVVVDEVRKLPRTALSLPITAASQALQTSMRVQQVVAELAIRGDEVFALLERPAEQPDWATFDDELEEDSADPTPAAKLVGFESVEVDADDDEANGEAVTIDDSAGEALAVDDSADEAVAAGNDTDGETAPAVNGAGGRFALYTTAPEQDEVIDTADRVVPEIVDYLDYDNLTLAQLRARLRSLSTDDLDSLLQYENSAAARPPFLTMLSNRITSARAR